MLFFKKPLLSIGVSEETFVNIKYAVSQFLFSLVSFENILSLSLKEWMCLAIEV